jgi:hypothetical protein
LQQTLSTAARVELTVKGAPKERSWPFELRPLNSGRSLL